jgi:hypothetical protein
MNVLDVEADMVPSLARNHPHTYEPIASRARLVAPHTQTSLAHWDPSQTCTCMGTLRVALLEV